MPLSEKDKKQIEKLFKSSDEYKNYVKAKEVVKADSELWRQINIYRKQRMELQQTASGDEIYERIEAFENNYSELLSKESAREYLDAELALCRMIQELGLLIVDAVEFE